MKKTPGPKAGTGLRPRASIESGRSASQVARLKSTLGELFKSQYFSVLATRSDGRLHTSLVAFAATEDLDAIVFATPRATRKFHYLSAHPEVSLFVDNRSNDAADIYNVTGVTVSGTAEALAGAGREEMLRLYLKKHPYMEEFVRSPDSALVRVNVRKYDVVTDFQNVLVLTIAGGERPQ